MSYLTQMLGLAVQNFLSAATGIAVLVALIRGFVRRNAQRRRQLLGRHDARDALRAAAAVARARARARLAGRAAELQAVPGRAAVAADDSVDTVKDVDGNPVKDAAGKDVTKETPVTQQALPLGPAASQIAIKQLGTNGGGFFNANSAHPFENPTPLSNFVELLFDPADSRALCYTFGAMVGDRRQGWALLATMLVIFVPLLLACSSPPSRPAIRRCMGSASIRPHRPCSPAATWKARRLRFGIVELERSGPPRRRPPRTARSMRCTIRSRRSAASCRCG